MKQGDDAQFTAFDGPQRLVSSSLAKVALAVKKWSGHASSSPIVIFDDSTGRSIDLDLRGTDREILQRFDLNRDEVLPGRGSKIWASTRAQRGAIRQPLADLVDLRRGHGAIVAELIVIV